jgi:hypothetical protein
MREEIRLGNEALAQNDLETAKRHFQTLLDTGGTPLQMQIAANRLREIQITQEGPRTPPAKPPRRPKASRDKTPRPSET